MYNNLDKHLLSFQIPHIHLSSLVLYDLRNNKGQSMSVKGRFLVSLPNRWHPGLVHAYASARFIATINPIHRIKKMSWLCTWVAIAVLFDKFFTFWIKKYFASIDKYDSTNLLYFSLLNVNVQTISFYRFYYYYHFLCNRMCWFHAQICRKTINSMFRFNLALRILCILL